MAQIIQNISVEVSKPNFFAAIVAKQYDSNSRFLKAKLIHDSKVVEIPNTSTTTINAKRSDGEEKSFAGEVNNDNTVTVPLAFWMLELVGTVKCDISVLGTDGSKLTSTTFVLEVQEASCDSGDVSADENYNVLVKLIEDVGKVTPDQTYKPSSKNAQSGVAVAEALTEATKKIIDQRNIFEGAEIYADENGNQASYTINSKGEIIEDTFYTDSLIYGYVKVKPNTLYSSIVSFRALAEYKADGTFIALNWTTKKVGNMYQFTTSEECELIRFSRAKLEGTKNIYNFYCVEGAYTEMPLYINHTHIEDVLICEGDIDRGAITSENIKYDVLQEEHCDFIETNKDFLKNATWQGGSCANYGIFNNLDGWCHSSFVPVNPSTEYVFGFSSNVSAVAFDKNKRPCKVNGTAGYGTLTKTDGKITTPDDCWYIVINTLPANVDKTTMYLSTANTAEPDTFTMPNLKIGINNLGGDVLASVKAPLSSILADLIFTTETRKIKLIGDSITHGMGSSDFAQSTAESDFLFNAGSFPQYRNYGVKCWAGMLKEYLESKFNCTVTNNGASGASAQQLVDNWDAIVSADDDVIICMIGTNDRGKTLATIYQSVVALYEKAQANKQRIIFMSAPPTSIENEMMKNDNGEYTFIIHMEDIDNLYNYVNNTLNVGYISIYKAFLNYCRDTGTSVDSLLDDGLHPNDEGYKLMFEIVLEALGFGRKRDTGNSVIDEISALVGGV